MLQADQHGCDQVVSITLAHLNTIKRRRRRPSVLLVHRTQNPGPRAGIRAARPADLGAVEQLCALLAADGIPPPDLISAFGSPDYRHYVVEREGQVRSWVPGGPPS